MSLFLAYRLMHEHKHTVTIGAMLDWRSNKSETTTGFNLALFLDTTNTSCVLALIQDCFFKPLFINKIRLCFYN